MPALARFGLILLSVGMFADLAFHSAPELFAPIFGDDGFRAHFVVFVGMAIVLVGVIHQGLRVHTSQRKGIHTSDAYR